MVIMAVYTIRSYILFTMVTNSGTDNGTLTGMGKKSRVENPHLHSKWKASFAGLEFGCFCCSKAACVELLS